MSRLRFAFALVATSCIAATALVPASSGSMPGDTYLVKIWMQGSGTIVSNPLGVSCPARCTGTFTAHANVTFTAKPAKGWAFGRWYVGCTGTKPVCVHEVGDGGLTVAASFHKKK